MNKKFNYNDNLEKVLTAIFGLVGMIAIFINLHLKGYGEENWLDAIKDLAGLIVVLAVFIASVRISSGKKTYTNVARAKLESLREKYPYFLLGPRYNREGYDPEKGQGLEYLFIKKEDKDSKLRAKFIQIQSLEEGILAIYVQKATLVNGLNYSSEQATTEEIHKIQEDVKNAVLSLVKNRYSELYEEVTPAKKEDTAVILDFNESAMGKRKFSKAVFECVECATEVLINKRNQNKSGK